MPLLNLRNVDLNLLTVFDAVMRDGNLSQAGRALGMTQPAVSNAVARLRQTFDDPLFVRNRYGMTPTSRATELIGPVREALGILQETLESATAFDPSRSDRTFRLAMGDVGELLLLPALLRLLRDSGGAMSIHTYPAHDVESLALLKRGTIDLFFDYQAPEDGRLHARPFVKEEVVVLARRGHPSIGTRLTKKAYLEAEHVVLAQPDPNRTLLESLWERAEPIPRKVTARVRQYLAMPQLVAQSDCLATVPRRMAEVFVRGLPLRIHRLPFDAPRVSTYMVWHRARERDRGHAWLKEAILGLAHGA